MKFSPSDSDPTGITCDSESMTNDIVPRSSLPGDDNPVETVLWAIGTVRLYVGPLEESRAAFQYSSWFCFGELEPVSEGPGRVVEDVVSAGGNVSCMIYLVSVTFQAPRACPHGYRPDNNLNDIGFSCAKLLSRCRGARHFWQYMLWCCVSAGRRIFSGFFEKQEDVKSGVKVG